jgi:crossover junction endodeoxyribonuclease RuvC
VTILGIDPGLANCGWGLISAGSQSARLLEYGMISTQPSSRLEDRVSFIGKAVRELMKMHHVDQVAIEDIYFVKNKASALSIAKVIGAVYYAAGLEEVKVTTYTPLQIKTTITGIGRADKNQVQQMIKVLLGLQVIPSPDHAADALAAAVCHFTHELGNQRLGQS